jgi:hypothetical protein
MTNHDLGAGSRARSLRGCARTGRSACKKRERTQKTTHHSISPQVHDLWPQHAQVAGDDIQLQGAVEERELPKPVHIVLAARVHLHLHARRQTDRQTDRNRGRQREREVFVSRGGRKA